MELKGEMSMLNILRLQEIDLANIQKGLEQKRDEAPQFFNQSPLVVDCSALNEQCEELDFLALREAISASGFIPVGIRGLPESINVAELKKAGWAIMRPAPTSTANDKESPPKSTNDKSGAGANNTETAKQAAPNGGAPIQSLTIERPVRSGQQVYAANGDMTVLSPTSSGSELVADGSIHVYGALRGRVLAGARGNEAARIFCHSLQAELIAIAGRYQLLDESDTDLKGKPAMIRLEGEKLIIEPLN